jgi:hypothetical protein
MVVKPGDFVLVVPWNNGVSFNRYYRGAARWSTVPEIGFYRFHRYDLIKQLMMASDQSSPVTSVIGNVAAALSTGHRVFLVGNIELPQSGPPPLLPPAPLPDRRWPSDRYADQWSRLATYYVQQHAEGISQLAIETRAPKSKYENLSVLVAEGWRP